MCLGLTLPPLSWEHPVRLSSSPHLKKKKKEVFPPLCVVVEVASILPLSLCHPVFLFCKSFCHGVGLSISTAMLSSRLGLRKVAFAPPASWGKVNHIPPVFMFGVSGVTCWSLPIVWGFLGTSIILHSALWNSLPGSCWMPRLLLWH